MSNSSSNSELVISYLTLRKAIGVLGVSLPFILYFGNLILAREGLQPSISDYYYTIMGDVFVGLLFAIGIFLFSYRGFDRRDDRAGDLACVFAIGVAIFPTPPSTPPFPPEWIGWVHYGSAGLLFFTFAYFCLKLFVKSNPDKPMTPQKRKRNKTYRACGYSIIVAIVLIPISSFLLSDAQKASLHPVFWLEAIAVIAFGTSWLVKGEAILADLPEQ